MRFLAALFLAAVPALSGVLPAAAQAPTEFGVTHDISVLGTGGTVADPNLEVKGFSIFGSTNIGTHISTASGNVIFNGAVEVSSDVYVTGVSTLTGNVHLLNQIRIAGGSPGANKVLTSVDGTGLATWQTVSAVGAADNLGNHVATKTITAGYGISGTTASFSSAVTASSFTATGIGFLGPQLGLANNVIISSESNAALGAGVRVSSNVYIVGFASATNMYAGKFYGDGSGLSGTGDNLGNHTATANLNMNNRAVYDVSTMTIGGGVNGWLRLQQATVPLEIKTHPGAQDYFTFAAPGYAGTIMTMNSANGNVGISTGNPQARLDVLASGSTASDFVQIWRNASGVIKASMSATGVLYATLPPGTGDDLGNHTAGMPLQMGAFPIIGTGSLTMSTGTFTGYVSANKYLVGDSTMVAILPGSNSIAYGVYAGTSNIVGGDFNTFIGNQAGQSNTTGDGNSFLGYQAGRFNTDGGSNSFLGYRAGYSNTTGANNSFVGLSAGYSNTTGVNNSFLGYRAGYYNQTGSGNALVGYGAGYGSGSVNSFSSSTIVGYQAGYSNTTGSDNIFLGWQAGYAVTTGSGNITIGYNQQGAADDKMKLNIGGLIYGDMNATSGMKVGIGTDSPGAKLEVAGQVKITGGSPGANKVLTTVDGTGLATWENASSLVSGDNLGSHVATTTLNMNSWNMVGVSSVNFKSNIFLTSATAANYGGVHVSTHIYTPGNLYANSLGLNTGITANDLSNDMTLADNSQTALPTEYAVKQYVDSKIVAGGGDTTWVRIYNNVLGSPQTSVTISGLNGDADLEYRLTLFATNASGGDSTYSLRPNNDSAQNYGMQFIYGVGATPGASNVTNDTGTRLCFALNNTDCRSETSLYAKSGQERSVITTYAQSLTGKTIDATSLVGGLWNNTASNITSLVIAASQTNGLGTGSRIELWARKGVSGTSNTLDQAYDQGGPGAGRQILADSGAVQLTGSNAADETLEVTNSANGGALLVENTGTGASLRVNDSAGDATPFIIDAGGKVGIGTTTLDESVVVSGDAAVLKVHNTGVAGSGGAGLKLFDDQGAAVAAGRRLGFLIFGGSTDTAHSIYQSAAVSSYAEELFSPTAGGAALRFETTSLGTLLRTEKMRISANGYLGISTRTPSYPLDVNGAAQVQGQAIVTGSMTVQNAAGISVPRATLASNVFVASATAAQQGGVYVSTNIYVNGKLRIVDGSQQNGFVLTSNASGLATWQSVSAVGAADNLGNHIATTTLNMAGRDIVGVGSMTFAGGGIRIGSGTASSESGIFISSYGAIMTVGTGTGTSVPGTRGPGAVDLQIYRTLNSHVASGNYSFLAGGTGNSASGANSAVVGGSGGIASGTGSAVFGGSTNKAGGLYSAVIGGTNNDASGNFSFAAGRKSSSPAQGSFTWKDSEDQYIINNVSDRTLFKNSGGFMVTGSTDTNMTGAANRGVFITGNGLVGISTGAPAAALDAVSTGTGDSAYTQIWRDSGGVIRASMTASGKLYADITGATGLPSGDNLGNHVATTTLNMASKPIVGVSSLTIIAPTTYPSSLWVSSSAATPHLYVSTAGRVGLGSNAPDALLQLTHNPGASQVAELLITGTNDVPGQRNFAIDIANTTSAPGAPDVLGIRLKPAVTATSGSTGNLYGVLSLPHSNGAGGTVTNAYGGYFRVDNTAGTINNLFGIVVTGPLGAGTIINKYALATASDAGNVGLGTVAPAAESRLDVQAAGNTPTNYAQIWRDSDGVVRASMTSTGVLYATMPPGTGDNLGNHIAGMTLRMGANQITGTGALTMSSGTFTDPLGVGAAQVKFGNNILMSSATAAQQGGVYVSTNIYVNGKLRIVDGSQQNGYVLTSNASGLATWQSVSAVGAADNLGNHIATKTITAGYGIAGTTAAFSSAVTASSFTATGIGFMGSQLALANNVIISSESSSALGAGVRVSSNVYIVGFASATNMYAGNFYGNGSGLTGVLHAGEGADNLGSHIATKTISAPYGISGTTAAFSSAVTVSSLTATNALGIGAPQHLFASNVMISSAPAAQQGGVYVSSNIYVAGRMQIVDGTQAANKILTSDANGLASWQTASAVAPGDNLGNHTATTTLNMAQFPVTNVSSIAMTGGGLQIGTDLTGTAYGIFISSYGSIMTIGAGHPGSVAPNARGMGAVDLQNYRLSASSVASGDYSVVAGGRTNAATALYATVAGGTNNTSSGARSVIAGGAGNVASGGYSAVAGGQVNTAEGIYSGALSGYGNTAAGDYSTVAGGTNNAARSQIATISGGVYNVVSGSNSAVGGGAYNTVTGTSTVVAGGEQNSASGWYSAVGGGNYNTVNGNYAAVSGGRQNTGSNTYTTVAGGQGNAASGYAASVAGGLGNTGSGYAATVAGGNANAASSNFAAALGGGWNTASGSYATVFGASNTAGGYAATVSGGQRNSALGQYSWAGGYASSSTANGAFTWADSKGYEIRNPSADRTLFKNEGGFMVTGSTVGGSAILPASLAMLDVISSGTAANVMAQVWRDNSGATGVVKASMSATGVMMATKFIGDGSGLTNLVGAADNLGNHVATTTLQMGIYGINSSSNITAGRYQINGSTVLALLPGANSLAVGSAANISTGTENTFVGVNAGVNNVGGNENTFVGANAGQANTTGGNYNTFIGRAAGYYFTSSFNTFVGLRAGLGASGQSTGVANTFLGAYSGKAVTSGSSNVFLGYGAGQGTETGSDNIFIGRDVASPNLAGSENVSIGNYSGKGTAATFSSSTLVGTYAGQALTSGWKNIMLGYRAGYGVDTGSGNIIIGYDQQYPASASSDKMRLNIGGLIYGDMNAATGMKVGINNPSPTNTLTVGGSAQSNANIAARAGNANAFEWGHVNGGGYGSTLGYQLGNGFPFLAFSAEAGTNNNTYRTRGLLGTIIYGNTSGGMEFATLANANADNQTQDARMLLSNSGDLSVGGNHAASGRLDVKAAGMASTDFAQVWRRSDGNIVASMTATGVLYATMPPGTGDNLGNHTAGMPLQMGPYGINSSSNITAGRYQINGSTVLAVLPGAGSLGLGVDAGRVNTGSFNSFLGQSAGYTNTSAENNTFVGYRAGYANTSGEDNTFVGYRTGDSNTTGLDNTFLGSSAGRENITGNRNSFLGRLAGFNNTTGTDNSYVGFYSGYNNQTGSANTIVGKSAASGAAGNSFSSSTIMGYSAGLNLTTGSDNLLLGFQAGDSLTSGSRNIIIGYDEDAPTATTNDYLNIGGLLHGDMAQSTMTVYGNLYANKFYGDGSGLTGISGDNLGSHVATRTITANYGIAGTTAVFTGSVTMGTATITGNSGVYGLTVSSNVSLGGALYTAGGRVGIGTASPASPYALDINGGLRMGDSGIFKLYTGGGAADDYTMRVATHLLLSLANDSGTNRYFKIGRHVTGVFTPQFVVNAQNGSVGINDDTPDAGLDIKSFAAPTGFALSVSSQSDVAGDMLSVRGDGNVGIGTASPGARLEVAGQVKITGGSPGANKVLTTVDGTGLATWENASSLVSGDNLGSHVATRTITANYGIAGTTAVFTGSVTMGTATITSAVGGYSLALSSGISMPAGTVNANMFAGNGALLTGLNASNVSAGTLGDARLSSNVNLLNANQTVTGVKTYTSSLTVTGNMGVGGFITIGGGSPAANKVLTAVDGTGLASWQAVSSLFTGDNLGTHVATKTITAGYGIAGTTAVFSGAVTASSFTATDPLGLGAAQVKFANNVLMSSATAAQYGGVFISTHVYLPAGARIYGDGSGLSGISGTLSGGQAPRMAYWTASNTLGNSSLSHDSANSLTLINSTFTVQGSAFSVGGSTFTVASGKVGIGVAAPAKALEVKSPAGVAYQVDTESGFAGIYVDGTLMVRLKN